MEKVTIIITAHNEGAVVLNNLRSIRLWNTGEISSVIVADNASTDDTRALLKNVDDITYVLFDDGKERYGQIINTIIRELEIEDIILLLKARYLLTPFCVKNLVDILTKNQSVAAVGGICNSFHGGQFVAGIQHYEQAVDYASQNSNPNSVVKVLGLDAGIVCIRKTIFLTLNGFDENLYTEKWSTEDYSLRLISNHFQIAYCPTSLFFDSLYGINNDVFKDKTENDMNYMYQKWNMRYFNHIHNENLIQLIDEAAQNDIRVLEIGCDCGATLLEIKNRYPNAEVYGVELNQTAANIASHFAIVQIDNIENCSLFFDNNNFDYIIFGDVLEHLSDPGKVLLYCQKLLKPDGCIIASIPNLQHISVIRPLLNGNFTYTETGLLDKTHIHFFTYNEIIRIFLQSGYNTERINSVILPISDEEKKYIQKILTIARGERFMFETFQFVIRARKIYPEE